ncbi:MAG: response regulator, partial [Desulfatitalea sp.]|nr:response regulator [Desulfatitalea sp.]NNK00815.1 response regulator [Desulfatitalea sp.]
FHFTAWVEKSRSAPAARVVPAALAGQRVLLADDHLGTLEILEQILVAAQMQVVCVDNGQAVVSSLTQAIENSRPFSVCLLDLDMPEVDGYAVLAQARGKLEKLANLPMFIALSSALERDAGKCEAAGFDGFQAKPVRRERLLQMISRLLGEGANTASKEDGSHKMHTQYSVREAMKHSVSILLAEDNPVNQKLAVMMLGKAGYTVTCADNGIAAVEMFDAGPEKYDMIFMDVQMPEMDGKEATRKLRSMGYTQVPIVAMTAHAMKGDREMCIEAGMNDYITKPIKREKVFEIIKEYVLDRGEHEF